MIVNRPNVYDNPRWRGYGSWALILAIFLFFFGLLLQILEIVRIYNGLYNNGMQNLNLVEPDIGQFLAVEQWHFWPWTYPGSQFGLIIMITGIIGIISVYRKTYSTVYAYMAFAIFSFLFSIYLIIYYSIMMNYYQRFRVRNQPRIRILGVKNLGSQSGTISNNVAGANLAFSILSLIFSLFAAIVAGRAARAGTETKRPYEPVGPYYPY
ncbi:unnamed protein product [Brachionus calyciflorus]|uniref:Uncharacterized protein n=1 Tax=Brachionus calyciflorus TaxID=104777 RepID=A0A814C8W2_9BILA|nr:unnamed protein product [Brachionus calyciflorus]